MEIAIIGGGNGCFAAAADLAEKGHRVRWWRRNGESFRQILDTQSIQLMDYQGTRRVKLDLVSLDLSKVLKGAELVVIPLPAPVQVEVAVAIAPYLEDGQVIYLPPGTFGSYIMSKALRDAGCMKEIVFAETGTLPYLARKRGPDLVAISARATRLPTGVFPAKATEYALHVLKQAFPVVEPLQDALDGALMNAGPVIHPPLILLNAGPIEHFPAWDIHNEGTQPAIRKVHMALDNERIAVREAFGYRAPHFPLVDHYHPEGEEWMYGRRVHEKLVDSKDWHEHLDLYTHRYMREDVACGLAFLVSLAQYCGQQVPVAAGLLAVASAILGEDLRNTGRTLENLGLALVNRVTLKALLQEGLGGVYE